MGIAKAAAMIGIAFALSMWLTSAPRWRRCESCGGSGDVGGQ